MNPTTQKAAARPGASRLQSILALAAAVAGAVIMTGYALALIAADEGATRRGCVT